MSKKIEKRFELLENEIKRLNKENEQLKQIVEQMWEETHPPVMGGK